MIWMFGISISLVIWLFLLIFWGDFWQANQYLDRSDLSLKSYPTVWAIIPARNEAEVISSSLVSLLQQDYPGDFTIVLVDDNSSDRTSELAQATVDKFDDPPQFKIISGKPLASGWKGKLWAMEQGINYARQQTSQPDYFLFTDADIYHEATNITQLVAKAERDNLDLVSLMVLLRCKSWWEKVLIPAFVFFFQKIYPFPWVNNPKKSLAAAAGGCILISSEALAEIGGVATIKDALIDDCSLAQAVKSRGKNIWLGLTKDTYSLRPYEDLQTIWDTIVRTAYTQLNYSFLLLIGTVIAMIVVYLAAPMGLIVGIASHNWLLVVLALITWMLMAIAYIPTIRLYDRSTLWTFMLPAIAVLYTLMTIESAIKYYQGQGGEWKGRTYK